MIYRTALPLTQFGNVPLMLWGCAAIGIFMGLIVALFSANYSAGRVVEPLQELTKAARSISAGDIPVRVENAPDEMGELSGAFNRMSERLAAAYQKLEQSNSQLAGILQGMNDGVVAVDGQDYPLMKGTAFEDSRKVDALLDAHGELRIKDHLRMQEPLSLRGAAEQARQASEQFTQDTPGISPAKENNR